MKVDTRNKNKALESLFADPAQIVFLDANFFIPPDRSGLMDRSRIKVKAMRSAACAVCSIFRGRRRKRKSCGT